MPTRTRWPGDEGYERMEFAPRLGWAAISSWGLNGWDLGNWPYVVVYHRGEVELAVDVEGDIDIEKFPTREERDRRTDEGHASSYATLSRLGRHPVRQMRALAHA
jgi:hypothetical protein